MKNYMVDIPEEFEGYYTRYYQEASSKEEAKALVMQRIVKSFEERLAKSDVHTLEEDLQNQKNNAEMILRYFKDV